MTVRCRSCGCLADTAATFFCCGNALEAPSRKTLTDIRAAFIAQPIAVQARFEDLARDSQPGSQAKLLTEAAKLWHTAGG